MAILWFTAKIRVCRFRQKKIRQFLCYRLPPKNYRLIIFYRCNYRPILFYRLPPKNYRIIVYYRLPPKNYHIISCSRLPPERLPSKTVLPFTVWNLRCIALPYRLGTVSKTVTEEFPDIFTPRYAVPDGLMVNFKNPLRSRSRVRVPPGAFFLCTKSTAESA